VSIRCDQHKPWSYKMKTKWARRNASYSTALMNRKLVIVNMARPAKPMMPESTRREPMWCLADGLGDQLARFFYEPTQRPL
jgi:hypothetical protein